MRVTKKVNKIDLGGSEIDLRAQKAFRRVEPVVRPLLELFANADEVFAEQGAFDPENIHKSLGRLYRSWKACRTELDPSFDPKRYEQEMKSATVRTTPLGRKRAVRGSQKRSSVPKSISEKSRKKTEKREKPSAKKSVRSAQSAGHVSGSRSRPKSSSVSGVGSHSESEVVSESGSKQRATRKSPKDKG